MSDLVSSSARPHRDGAAGPGTSDRTVRVGYVLKQYPRLSETFILNEILGLEATGEVDVEVYSLRHATEGRFHPGVADVRGRVHYLSPADKSAFLGGVRALAAIGTERLDAVLHVIDHLAPEARARTLLHALEIADRIDADGVDHLHAHFLTVAAQTAHLVHLLTGVSYTVTAHAKDIYRHTVDWDLAGRIAGAASAVITVCDANLSFLARRLDGTGARIVRVYNGIEPPPPPPDLSQRRRGLVLGVGRLVEKKGFDVMLDAVAELAARRPEVSCVLVGDGDDRPALERRARALGIADRVHFTGALGQHEVAEWMRRAHVMAAPCRVGTDGNQDALPTVLVEALGAGLPAVTTAVAGIPEIIEHGGQGLIVPEDDAAGTADALEALLADDERWAAMSVSGPAALRRRFDRRDTIAQLTAVLAGRSARSAAPAGVRV